jgi:hypothetical protein
MINHFLVKRILTKEIPAKGVIIDDIFCILYPKNDLSVYLVLCSQKQVKFFGSQALCKIFITMFWLLLVITFLWI